MEMMNGQGESGFAHFEGPYKLRTEQELQEEPRRSGETAGRLTAVDPRSLRSDNKIRLIG